MTRKNDSASDTLKHRHEVIDKMNDICMRLMQRGVMHDDSKLEPPEKDALDAMDTNMRHLSYGSAEYMDKIKEAGPMLERHRENARHHPEYHGNDFAKMDLLDVVEMLCDWKAATMRHQDGDILKSLEINAKKYDMPEPVRAMLENTIKNMKWK